MKKTECRSEILNFKFAVENYRRTILNNGYSPLPSDALANLLPVLRSQLNQKLGKMGFYIDAITGVPGSAYLKAFSDGSANEVIPAVSSVIDNLDWIVGKLDAMTDDEFETIIADEKRQRRGLENIHSIKHPHYEYWKMIWGSGLNWFKRHTSEIIVGVLVIVIAAWIGFK